MVLQALASALYAFWWVSSANNGHTLRRQIFHGTHTSKGPELTDQEKVDEAMETANQHIRRISDIADNLSKLT